MLAGEWTSITVTYKAGMFINVAIKLNALMCDGLVKENVPQNVLILTMQQLLTIKHQVQSLQTYCSVKPGNLWSLECYQGPCFDRIGNQRPTAVCTLIDH